jgi:hypothetical protein
VVGVGFFGLPNTLSFLGLQRLKPNTLCLAKANTDHAAIIGKMGAKKKYINKYYYRGYKRFIRLKIPGRDANASHSIT